MISLRTKTERVVVCRQKRNTKSDQVAAVLLFRSFASTARVMPPCATLDGALMAWRLARHTSEALVWGLAPGTKALAGAASLPCFACSILMNPVDIDGSGITSSKKLLTR